MTWMFRALRQLSVAAPALALAASVMVILLAGAMVRQKAMIPFFLLSALMIVLASPIPSGKFAQWAMELQLATAFVLSALAWWVLGWFVLPESGDLG